MNTKEKSGKRKSAKYFHLHNICAIIINSYYSNNIMTVLFIPSVCLTFSHASFHIVVALSVIFCTYVICFRNQSGAVDDEKREIIAKKNIIQENGKPES